MHLGLKTIVIAIVILIVALLLLMVFMNLTEESSDMAKSVFDMLRKISPFKF
ncbi:MAG: hypothetical protein QW051_03615 [Candidatus Aenigmatarchaeota archaeon]